MAAPRNENIREKILKATQELLQVRSLSDISLAQIAKGAGISKGTLYYYYKSKTDILLDITDIYLDRQWNELIAWTGNREKDTSLPRLVKYVMERSAAASNIRVHLINAAMLGDEDLRRKLINRYAQFEDLIAQKIAERSPEGVDANYLSRLILLAADGLIIQEAIRNPNFDREAFISLSGDYIKSV